jgi:hypothetical protein
MCRLNVPDINPAQEKKKKEENSANTQKQRKEYETNRTKSNITQRKQHYK